MSVTKDTVAPRDSLIPYRHSADLIPRPLRQEITYDRYEVSGIALWETVKFPTWAKEQSPLSIPAINRAVPGSRTGVLTKASSGMVRIDRSTYPLAARALIEDKFGTPLMSQDLQWDDVEFDVRYWLGTDQTRDQIIQMIITFPE